jgi:hypothetical protein
LFAIYRRAISAAVITNSPAASSPAGGSYCSPTIAPRLVYESTDPLDRADIAEPNEANDPTENAEANDPIDPIDIAEPTDPIDRNDLVEPIERTESSDHRER